MTERFKADYLTCLKYLGYEYGGDAKNISGETWYFDKTGSAVPYPDHNFCAEVVEKIEEGVEWLELDDQCKQAFEVPVQAFIASVETKLEILARTIEECGLL